MKPTQTYSSNRKGRRPELFPDRNTPSQAKKRGYVPQPTPHSHNPAAPASEMGASRTEHDRRGEGAKARQQPVEDFDWQGLGSPHKRHDD